MLRSIGCWAVLLLAVTPLRAGELDAEYGAAPAAVSATVPDPKTISPADNTVPPLLALPRLDGPVAWSASELDAESPSQAWGFRGFGWGGGFGRGFGWGGGWGFGRGLGWGGWGGGWGFGRGLGWGGYGLGWGGWGGGYGLGWGGWGGGYGLGWGGYGLLATSYYTPYWGGYGYYPSWGWGCW